MGKNRLYTGIKDKEIKIRGEFNLLLLFPSQVNFPGFDSVIDFACYCIGLA